MLSSWNLFRQLPGFLTQNCFLVCGLDYHPTWDALAPQQLPALTGAWGKGCGCWTLSFISFIVNLPLAPSLSKCSQGTTVPQLHQEPRWEAQGPETTKLSGHSNQQRPPDTKGPLPHRQSNFANHFQVFSNWCFLTVRHTWGHGFYSCYLEDC